MGTDRLERILNGKRPETADMMTATTYQTMAKPHRMRRHINRGEVEVDKRVANCGIASARDKGCSGRRVGGVKKLEQSVKGSTR